MVLNSGYLGYIEGRLKFQTGFIGFRDVCFAGFRSAAVFFPVLGLSMRGCFT